MTRHPAPRTRDLLLLAALCLALYLPGLASLPPIDRDEARFMQATRQMVDSGDLVRPRFQSEDRFRKPIGIYWLQSLSVWIAGGDETTRVWPYRLPSVLGAIAAVLLTYAFGVRWYPRLVALTGAALLAASMLLVVEAHLATTDAALLALIVAAQGCLGMLYLAAQRGQIGAARYAAGFWLAQAVAILIKGPVAPLISALTIAATHRSAAGLSNGGTRSRVSVLGIPSSVIHGRAEARPSNVDRGSVSVRAKLPGGLHLRPLWGIALLLLIVLPWTIAIAHETDGAFFQAWWHGDVLPKLVGGHESHGAPPGTHLALLAATFWPGSLALVPAVLFVRARRRPVERFCLAWLVPSWLVFELMPTKLPHYILPLLPPVALLCARAVWSAHARRLPRWAAASIVIWTLLGSAIAAGVIAIPLLVIDIMPRVATLAAIGVAGSVIIAACAASAARWGVAIPATLTASVILSVALLGSILPRLEPLWLSRSVVAAIDTHAHRAARAFAAAGYHEPSLVFLARDRVELVDPEGLAAFIERHPDRLALITADERDRFDAAAAARGIGVQVLWSSDGIHYSKGRRTRLLLCAAEGNDAAAADHQALLAW